MKRAVHAGSLGKLCDDKHTCALQRICGAGMSVPGAGGAALPWCGSSLRPPPPYPMPTLPPAACAARVALQLVARLAELQQR
eukprot:355604-Chlamydomonas_euryale.AAC.5